MSRSIKLFAVLLTFGLIAAACSDDSDDSSSSTTADDTTSTTEETTTTTTLPSATVAYDFDTAVDETQATQAADTMARRLDQAGYPGSEAVVNAEGTGLEITVVGVTTEAEATEVVNQLTFIGQVYYRPVMEGPIAPGPGETPSQFSEAVIGADPTSTSLPGSDEASTTPEADDPEATSLLAWYDSPDRTSVIARYSVGPQQLDGTTTEDTDTTTVDGNPGVQIVFNDAGLEAFNGLASQCYNREATCPGGSAEGPGAYAIEFDGAIVVVSVPRGGQDSFTPFTQEDVIIHSPYWSEETVQQLAVALEAGALPVTLTAA